MLCERAAPPERLTFMENKGLAIGRGLVVVCLLIAGAARVSAETVVRPSRMSTMPGTMLIAPELQASVDAMLEMSPTFRQQFERIARAPKLILNARIDISVTDRPFRARSSIRRFDSGLIVVCMDIAPDAIHPEWIAHEFEHVLEQLDGVNVRALAEHRKPGAWYSSGQMVETARATNAGRMVRNEMRSRRGRPDKFVE